MGDMVIVGGHVVGHGGTYERTVRYEGDKGERISYFKHADNEQ